MKSLGMKFPRLEGQPASVIEACVMGTYVLLESGQAPTITNDAEAVIYWLDTRDWLAGRRVLYLDTMGRWDELLVRDGRFAGFAPIGASSAYEAMEIARDQALDERRMRQADSPCGSEGES